MNSLSSVLSFLFVYLGGVNLQITIKYLIWQMTSIMHLGNPHPDGSTYPL